MTSALELNDLFFAREGLPSTEALPQVAIFDLGDPEQQSALLNHVVKDTVLVEGKPIPMTFWVERDELGEVRTVRQIEVHDIVDSQLERLFLIEHPQLVFGYKMQDPEVLRQMAEWRVELVGQEAAEFGVAYYYPDKGVLIHGVGPELDTDIRTASNRGLISKEEQERLSRFNVCFLGLSVGNSALRTWQMEADPRAVRGGDPDSLENSNLNRMMASRCNIGSNKASLAITQILGHSPFTKADLRPEGLALAQEASGLDQVAKYLQEIINSTEDIGSMSEAQAQEILDQIAEIVVRSENFGQIFNGVNAIVEVMDNLRMKILARLGARKLGIPVLMASDMGDTVLLDVERFDQDPTRQIFHGLVPAKELLACLANPSPQLFASMATKMVGAEYMPPDFIEALKKIGSELVSPPQTASTIAIAAGILTKRLRDMALSKGDQFSRKEYYDFAGFNFYIIPIVPKVHDI